MNYTYINNPLNDTKVLLSSKLGKSIIKNYLYRTQLGGKCSRCGKDGHNMRTCKHMSSIPKKPIKAKQSRKSKTCSLCGATGVTKKTCPYNPSAKQVNRKKHNLKPKKNKTKTSSLPTIKKIVGPIKLAYWDIHCPNNTKKKLLFISDLHTNILRNCNDFTNKNCYDIDDIISMLIKKAEKENKCIDLFVENSITKLSGPKYLMGGTLHKNEELIDQIKKIYKACSQHSLKENYFIDECENTNLRFHNLDIRHARSPKRDGRQTNKLDSMLFYLKNPTVYSHKRDYKLLAKYILGYPIKKTETVFLEKIIDSIILSGKKELHPDTPIAKKQYTRTQIMREMNSFRKAIQKEYKKFLLTKDSYLPDIDLRDLILKTVSHNFDITGGSYQEYTHLFTDLYVLCRIFMEFKTNKNKQSRSPIKCPIIKDGHKTINISPNRVIILAGGDHLELYNSILSKYFPSATHVFTKKEKDNKILKVSDMSPEINSFSSIFNKFLE